VICAFNDGSKIAGGILWIQQGSSLQLAAALLDVVNHYDTQFNLQLNDSDKKDLIEYLKGI
jgi:hypothetical protein